MSFVAVLNESFASSRSSIMVLDLSLSGRLMSMDSVEADPCTKLLLLLLLLLMLLFTLLIDAMFVVTMLFAPAFCWAAVCAGSFRNANESVVEANLFSAVLLLSISSSFNMRNIRAYSGFLSAYDLNSSFCISKIFE